MFLPRMPDIHHTNRREAIYLYFLCRNDNNFILKNALMIPSTITNEESVPMWGGGGGGGGQKNVFKKTHINSNTLDFISTLKLKQISQSNKLKKISP